MLEKVGSKEVLVRNYLDNFNVKEFIQEELIPKAFPDVPLTKMNLGFTGVISDYISQAIEDSQYTASLMINEAFPTKAMLPESIYAHGSLFDLGFQFAVPSSASFAIEISINDIIENSIPLTGSNTYRYQLDRDTSVVIGSYQYTLDYDIIIDHSLMNGKRVFSVYYDMDETNSLSSVTNKYIKHQVVGKDWLVIFLNLKEYTRRSDTVSIVDNLITTNSDIELKWTGQLAGVDLIYITPTGIRIPMLLKPKFARPSVDPFVWYRMHTENSMYLSFSPSQRYWTPDFNSQIEFTIYTCHGAQSNFVSYDRKTELPVKKSSNRFSYNSGTSMAAFSLSGSQGGINKGSTETLRREIISAYNTADALVTDRDIQSWFDEYGQRNNSISTFFKRRDDLSGRLFSGFVALYDENNILYDTNTLNIHLDKSEFDYVNTTDGEDQEFIIRPGHLWEYVDESRDTVRMVKTVDGAASISTDDIQLLASQRPFLFVNPFMIRIYKKPTIAASYSFMLSHTSYPEEVKIESKTFHQFQLRQFSIDRSLTNDVYHIEVICSPIVTEETEMTYVNNIGSSDNNLRLLLFLYSKNSGETGYVEMIPTEQGEENSIIFSTDIYVRDNVNQDGEIEVDCEKSNVTSLISAGERAGRSFIDSTETRFDFLCLVKDPSVNENLYFEGYTLANRYRNDYRSLELYQPITMMRNTVLYTETEDGYEMDISFVPLLKYDIPLDNQSMKYFVQCFEAQYKAMEPILSRLDGNSFIDFKLYNTYGRSNNYYIGPQDGVLNLKDSNLLLDDIQVRVKLVVSVYDRSLYTQTVEDIKTHVLQRFAELRDGTDTDVHMSTIIRDIIDNVPNVRYVRFLGFNNYDANKQSIFKKLTDTSNMNQSELSQLVPEIIRVNESGIEVSEET